MAAEGDSKVALPSLNAVEVKAGDVLFAFTKDSTFHKAKVVKVMEAPQPEDYSWLVHYPGWNKKFDEVLGADRLMPVTDESEAYVKTINAKVAAARKPAAAPAAGGRTRGQKRAATRSAAPEEAEARPRPAKAARVETPAVLKLPLQGEHKQALVRDWEMIVNKRCLVRLPKGEGVTVRAIIAKYEDTLPDNADGKEARSTLAALQLYFDRSLPVHLLYRFERHQFDQLLKAHLVAHPTSPFPASTVFGGEHLLRLLVKLPDLLAASPVKAATLNRMSACLGAFFRWFARHASKFLSQEYVRGDTEYIEASLLLPESLAVDLSVLPPLTKEERKLSAQSLALAAKAAAAREAQAQTEAPAEAPVAEAAAGSGE